MLKKKFRVADTLKEILTKIYEKCKYYKENIKKGMVNKTEDDVLNWEGQVKELMHVDWLKMFLVEANVSLQ